MRDPSARRPEWRPRILPALVLLVSAAGMAAGAGPPDAPGDQGSAQPGGKGSLRWPLDLPRSIGSPFGEYRYDHLHAGIDISTGGGTGYAVRATAAGEVYRLKVEWRGYGKAIYLRHPGGRVTVYGHLERYEDRILGLERLVARRRAEAGTRYPGDIYLDRPLRVARGQVIAYSGESGVGLPHLHFEVRGPGDAPVDPFRAGLPRPADRRPPVLTSLTITAASATTFIEGTAREMAYPLTAGTGGVLTTARPIRLNGPFLAALSAYDPAGGSGRAGIAALDVAIDGAPRYRLALRAFRFEQYPQAGLVFDHRFSRLGPPAFAYRLSRLPGNELANGSVDTGGPLSENVYPGSYDLPPGSHVMEVTAGDGAGNRASARVCVQVARAGILMPAEWDGAEDAPRGVRFRLSEDAAAVRTAGGKTTRSSDCPRSSIGVEAEFWNATMRAFSPMTCRLGEGVCLFPAATGGGVPGAVRLREIEDGVPGPWRLLVKGVSPALDPNDTLARVEAWPASLDILVTLGTLPGPAMRLAAGLRHDILEDLAYRDDLAYFAAIGYPRASARAPFFVVADDAPAPLASLVLDARFIEQGRAFDYQGPGFSLHLPEKARFFAGPLALRTDRIAGTERLPSIADAVEILPEGEALNDRGTLSFDVEPGAVAPETLGIYRWDASRSRWSYEAGELEEGGSRLSLRFRRYGRFALLQDASPPDLLEVRPAKGSVLTTRRPALTARVEDEGKGLNYDGVIFELDGRRLESEFDPDRGLSKVLEPPALSPGSHHLRVTAVDLAGNASPSWEGDFEIAH